MLLAIMFGIIALVCFVYGLRQLRKVWQSRGQPMNLWELTLICVVLVASAVGFWRALIELGIVGGP